MPLTILEGPAALPLTLVEIKQHLRIDHDSEDSYLTELCRAATDHVEKRISRFLIRRTVRQHSPLPDRGEHVVLETGPVASIENITGLDAEGTAHPVEPNHYRLEYDGRDHSVDWSGGPELAGMFERLEIDFVAGYGEAGPDLPASLIRSILVLTAHWYEVRGAPSGNDLHAVPQSVGRLIEPFRRLNL